MLMIMTTEQLEKYREDITVDFQRLTKAGNQAVAARIEQIENDWFAGNLARTHYASIPVRYNLDTVESTLKDAGMQLIDHNDGIISMVMKNHTMRISIVDSHGNTVTDRQQFGTILIGKDGNAPRRYRIRPEWLPKLAQTFDDFLPEGHRFLTGIADDCSRRYLMALTAMPLIESKAGQVLDPIGIRWIVTEGDDFDTILTFELYKGHYASGTVSLESIGRILDRIWEMDGQPYMCNRLLPTFTVSQCLTNNLPELIRMKYQ